MDYQKRKSLFKTILFLAALGAVAYYFNLPSVQNSNQGSQQVEQAKQREPNVSTQTHSSIGFASKQKLTQHFQKHGAEFGNISLADYLSIAQNLRDRPIGNDILEYVRPDGIASRYDKSSGTFVAFNSDKTIRTCFKPNDGERYFQRQKNKNH
jgi:pyocin large subunit-like protein